MINLKIREFNSEEEKETGIKPIVLNEIVDFAVKYRLDGDIIWFQSKRKLSKSE